MEPYKKRRRIIKIIHTYGEINNNQLSSQINYLPKEILLYIFTFLRASDVVRAKVCCKKWFYEKLPIHYDDNNEIKCSLESFIHFAPSVEKIYLHSRGLPRGFFTLLSCFQNIHQLHLHRCLIEGGFFDLYQLRTLPKLKVLGLWNTNIGNDDFRNIAFLKNLRFLDLTGTSINDENLRFILEHLHNLEQLCLIQCHNITAEAFNIINYSPLKKICLEFRSRDDRSKFNEYKYKFPNYEELKVCDVDHPTRHVFNLINVHP